MSISDTRSSSLAQFNRIGRWRAQFASHSAGDAAWAGGSGSCGTTIARSLALGACTLDGVNQHVRSESLSPSLSAMQVEPSSSTNTPDG